MLITEEVKGEKDAGKEIKAAKEETTKVCGKPQTERPRFMFNIADGGFTGWPCLFHGGKAPSLGFSHLLDFLTISAFQSLKK